MTRALDAFLMSAGLIATADIAFSEAPFLGLPLDCMLGETCFIEDYVDVDAGPSGRDYTCGPKTRDGHKGTDFALLDFEMLEAGVNVLAAAPGIVVATRDGMADTPVTPESRVDIAGRECGNAVSLLHDNGYRTTYCHLKEGSLTVSEGNVVARGDVVGEVGLSGLTNYPHVHLSVVKDRATVDPFAPDMRPGICNSGSSGTLWLDPIPYEPTGLFTVGFANGVPNLETVDSGTARIEETAGDIDMVLYSYGHFVETGDTLSLEVTRPDGSQVFAREFTIEKGQKRLFRAFGRRAPDEGWPSGIYLGETILKRGERIIATRHTDLVIE